MGTIVSRILLPLLTVVLLSAAPRADDWTGPKEVAKAAREFATATEKLQKAIKDVKEDSSLAAEVLSLSRSTTQLHDSVEKGATYEKAKKDFRKIESGYVHFEAELKKAHEVHHEKPVAETAKRAKATFDQLQAHMTGRSSTARIDQAGPRPSQEDNR